MIRAIAMYLVLLFAVGNASAATVSVQFNGAITQIQTIGSGGLGFPSSKWGIAIRQAVTGSMTYDGSAPADFVSSTFAVYSPDVTFRLVSEAITIDGAATGSDSFFVVENDQFNGSVGAVTDTLNAGLLGGLSFAGSVTPEPGFELDSVQLFMRTQDLSFLDSFDLPEFSAAFVDPNIADLFTTHYAARFDFVKTVGEREVATFVAGLNTVTFSSDATQGTQLGGSAQNPFLPTGIDEGGGFTFGIDGVLEPTTEIFFIDPLVAVGYEYSRTSGPNFASVIAPALPFDFAYDLFLLDNGVFVDSGVDLQAGVEHIFAAGGVESFQIRGIDVANALSPTDDMAFVTGLSLTSRGPIFGLTQRPLTQFVPDPVGVPAPGMFGLIGIACLALRLRR